MLPAASSVALLPSGQQGNGAVGNTGPPKLALGEQPLLSGLLVDASKGGAFEVALLPTKVSILSAKCVGCCATSAFGWADKGRSWAAYIGKIEPHAHTLNDPHSSRIIAGFAAPTFPLAASLYVLGVGKHEGVPTLAPRFLQHRGTVGGACEFNESRGICMLWNLDVDIHQQTQAVQTHSCSAARAVLPPQRPHLLLAGVPGCRHIGALVLGDVVAGAPTT